LKAVSANAQPKPGITLNMPLKPYSKMFGKGLLSVRTMVQHSPKSKLVLIKSPISWP